VTQTRLVFDEKQRVAKWVAERVGQLSSWGGYYAMGAELNGELTAGLVFNNFTDSNASVHLAVSTPTKGMRELLDHGFLYAFKTCSLRRLTAPVEASNAKSLRIVKHIGFVPEAVMAQAGTNGQDIHLLVLWPEKYFKGKKHG
jgi:RimJ/RimL family protein N-acetyltransferase